jgi:hypothetical protein
MPRAQTKKTSPYCSGRAASARTGLTQVELLKMAAAGRIRALALPGSAIKFLTEDVTKLAREMNPAASE